MDTIEITPARAADVQQILALQHAAYRIEAMRYDDATLPPLTETIDELRAVLGTHTVLVARHSSGVAAAADDPIVGAVRARVDGGIAHIGRLAVVPDMHGRGIGRRLLWGIEVATAPVERYALFTGHRSDRNLRMYERAGYVRTHTQRLAPVVTLIHMEKRAHPHVPVTAAAPAPTW